VQASLNGLQAPETLRWERFDRVRGRIARGAEQWELGLEFVKGSEVRRRTFQARECGDLADAAAVAIVLALQASETDPSSLAPPQLTPADAAPALAPRHTASERLALDVGAEGLLDPSTLGSAAFGAGVFVRGRLEPWSAALYGVLLPSARMDLGGSTGIDLGLWAGGVRSCWQLRASIRACASGEAGRVSARGVGLRSAESSHDLWLAPGLSVELATPLSQELALHSSIAGLMPLVRGQFRVDRSVVHELPPVALRVGVGLDLALRGPGP
jgi:hypothetical protein